MTRSAVSAKTQPAAARQRVSHAEGRFAKQEADKPARIRRTRAAPAPEPCAPVVGATKTKQAAVVALLQRPEGVTIAEVIAATGWQPHTTRGFFSGTVKKKLGLDLSSVQEDRGRVYRISAVEQET